MSYFGEWGIDEAPEDQEPGDGPNDGPVSLPLDEVRPCPSGQAVDDA